MSLRAALGEGQAPRLSIELRDDRGQRRAIDALIDTAFPGELVLGRVFLGEVRRAPADFRETWSELNPEPLPGAGPRPLPAWRGTIALAGGKPERVKVHEDRRPEAEARLGRAFLARFEIVLVLDIERGELQALSRQQRKSAEP